MNLNPSLSLKEQYGPKSEAWQEQQSPPIVRFWCDHGVCWAIPFFQIALMHYHPEEQTLLIECSPGIIVVMGPKAWEFCERLCNHKVALLKAGGEGHLLSHNGITIECRLNLELSFRRRRPKCESVS
jgi:hypothetical protein